MYIINFKSNLSPFSLRNLCPTLNLIIGVGTNPNKVLIEPLVLLNDFFNGNKIDNLYMDIDLIDNDTQYNYTIQVIDNVVVYEELSKEDSIIFRRGKDGSFTSISSKLNQTGCIPMPYDSFFVFCEKTAFDSYFPEILPVYKFLYNITINKPDIDIYKLLLVIFSSQEDNPLILLENIDANLDDYDCITLGTLFSRIFPTLKSQSFIEAYSKDILDVIPLKYWQIIKESKVCNMQTTPHIFKKLKEKFYPNHSLIYSSLMEEAGVITWDS